MSQGFTFDVFLSHSAKDRTLVRPIAERLRRDGLRVWFEEAGDLEEGLEHSRALVLCLSENAFGPDWPQLQAGAVRFRDPLNSPRRFIPLRLDKAPLRDIVAQVPCIVWPDYESLHQACLPPTVALSPPRERDKIISLGHTAAIRSVAFSPNGRQAVSASEDHTVRLWEVGTGRCVKVIEGHTDSVLSVMWSPDGRQLLTGSADRTLRIWNVQNGDPVRVLDGHTDNVRSVAWSPDGGRALSGCADGTVRVWNLQNGECLHVLSGHFDSASSVVWSPDGRSAVSGAHDKTVRIWDVDSGNCLQVLKGHFGGVWCVAWSPDGRRVLSSSDDHTVRIWDVKTGACRGVLEKHADPVRSVVWSPDGSRALTGSADTTVRVWEMGTGRCLRVLEAHRDGVRSVAWSPDGRLALSGGLDNTVRLWDAATGSFLRVFEGHSDRVNCAAWSPDGRALSASKDKTLRLWGMETGRSSGILEGHSSSVWSVGWAPDGRRAISCSLDNTVRLWDVEAGRALVVLGNSSRSILSAALSPDGHRVLSGCADGAVLLWDVETGRLMRALNGHSDKVLTVAWSPDGSRALSGADDRTLRVWDPEGGRLLQVLEGHAGSVESVAWNPDGRRALSGANDQTVRLWDLESGRLVRVLEGHSGPVLSVAWSPDGHGGLSGSADCTVRLWDVETGRSLRVLRGHSDRVWSVAWSPDGRRAFSAARNGVMRVWDLTDLALPSPRQAEAQVQYTNAKVLLVGESGAGKTGLSMRLALDDWKPSESTVGAWATHWKLPVSSADGVEREIWLWDFGGQADQRLIHQLYMEDTALAVLVFDGQKEDLFETLGQWDRDLTRASRNAFVKLLAAGRVDTGGLRVSRTEVERLAKERGFRERLFETSAKTGSGCEELRQAILNAIDWQNIPWRSSPRVFQRLKEEIVRLKDEGRVLMRFNELRDALRLRLAGQDTDFEDAELKAVVSLLAGPGVVWELKFGGWVLLQPERINAYAQAVIQTLREDEHERGCIAEERVLRGDLKHPSAAARLDAEDERFVLLAMHQTLVERALCLREHTDRGTLLIFPSYYRRERPELTGHPAVLVSYRFNGFLDDIYATLVVRLHHTNSFQQDHLWRYAADFKTQTGKKLGVRLTRRAEGTGELELYFDPAIPDEAKIIFIRYVHEHLLQKARDMVRLRHYVCPHCERPVRDREVAMERLQGWLERQASGRNSQPPSIVCVNCERRVPLWDDLEQSFASDEIRQRVVELRKQSELVLSNESKERALVGEVISVVALAGQLSREFNVSDKGIDMEVEFLDDAGEASGRKLYLQLKSGDSYLHERKSDGAEIFTIRDERHGRYWMAQQFPVLLVIRASSGEIRWMEVRDWLKRESEGGRKSMKQIVFEGERFDALSVRRWRDRLMNT